MAINEKEVAQQLTEAGKKLHNPPPSVDELLSLLDQVESCLSKVEQSPKEFMQAALGPLREALVADQLFRHADGDVNVAVASCISEITRITAPDPPYDDDQMKAVFQLIVSAFESLADKSSRSYSKRTAILETVSKVRSCVMMLDLDCEPLIIEMFQHFLNSIREYHPENIFESMENIMFLVLDDSEEVSTKLLSPFLASTKRDNEKVLPIGRKLAEQVLERSAAKVKPYLQKSVKELGISFDDYSDIVGSICQGMSDSIKLNDCAANENKAEESNRAGPPSDEDAQAADVETAAEAGSPKQADPMNEKSPKSAVSNGVAQVGEEDSLADSGSLKQQEPQEDENHACEPKVCDTSSNADRDILDAEKVVNEESKPEQDKENKVDSSAKSAELSEGSDIEPKKAGINSPDVRTPCKDAISSHQKETSVGTGVSLENKKEGDRSPPSSPIAEEGESMAVSPSGSCGILDEKKDGRSKKKGSLIKDSKPSADDIFKKTAGGTTPSETKASKKAAKKASGKGSNEKAPMDADASKKESSPASISKKNATKNLSKAGEKEKISSLKSSAKSAKDVPQSKETPKTDTKRKRASGSEKASETEDGGENLVGVRIRVYWPDDEEFYKGEIIHYDPKKRKHTVSYDDGDEEKLILKNEKWELIEVDSAVDEDDEAESKKAKLGANQVSSKKADASPSKGGGSSKSKTAAKSSQKSKEAGKTDTGSKAASKSKNDNVSASKSGKSKEDVSKTPKDVKSKQDASKIGKSKQNNATVTPSTKGKSPKSSGKSSANGTGKSKSGSAKVKEVKDVVESTDSESDKPQESMKGKSSSSSKRQGSELKSGKKRRRV